MTLRPVRSTEQALHNSRLHSEPLSRNQNNQITAGKKNPKNHRHKCNHELSVFEFYQGERPKPWKALTMLKGFCLSPSLWFSHHTAEFKGQRSWTADAQGPCCSSGLSWHWGLILALFLNTALHFLRSRDPSSYCNSTDFGITFIVLLQSANNYLAC